MRALIQRVAHAKVEVDGQVTGQIEQGLLILVCAMDGDAPDAGQKLATKIAKLRIFSDENGKMNKSIVDIAGSALIVSQFTLAADMSRGNRPSFINAARPEISEPAYEGFCKDIQALGIPVERGVFGASMQVSLLNDGPATFWIDL